MAKPSLAFSQVCISRKLELEAELGFELWNFIGSAGVPSGILTMAPSTFIIYKQKTHSLYIVKLMHSKTLCIHLQ